MVRRVAVRILAEGQRSRSLFAAERIHGACRDLNLAKRDRRFLTELVFGVLRHELTLDCVVAAYSRRPLKDLSRKVVAALRLGVYQLLYLDGVPAFAAIHETVSSVGTDPKQRAFVNGLLRAVDREVRRVPAARDRGGASPRKRLQIHEDKICFFSRPVFRDPEQDLAGYLAEVYSHGPFLVRRWLERFGQETTTGILERNNRPPQLFVRCNRLQLEPGELLERLHRESIRCRAGGRPESIHVDASPTELVRTRTFRDGRCTVQDETAMGVAPRLQPQPGQRYLDLCAAPGGKATHLAELSEDRAFIVAADRDETRLQRLRQSCERLHLQSIHVLALDLLEDPRLPGDLAQPFAGVLVDAPCSNSGVLGRRPEARRRVDAERLATLTSVQAALLDQAALLVAPGGRLLYSTCSVEQEENTQQVRAFLQRQPRFRCEEEAETLPGEGDGGYVAVFQLDPVES